MTNFVVHFDIAALIVSLALTIEFNIRHTISSRQTSAFLRILVTSILACAFDIASAWGIVNAAVVPMWAVNTLNVLYNLFFQGMGPTYYYYSVVATSNGEYKMDGRTRFLIFGHYSVSVVLTLLSPFLGCLFYFDENLIYHHGPFIFWSYYAAMFYLVSSFVRTFKSKVSKNYKFVIILYTVAILIAMALQFVFEDYLLINFSMMIGILLVSFTRENPMFYESQTINAYNTNAFSTVVTKKIYENKSFIVLGIKVDGLAELREIVGTASINNTLNDIAQYLKSITERDKVFYISDVEFAMIVTGGSAEMEMFVKKIRNRFKDPFVVSNEKVHLQVLMSRFESPTDASTTDSVLNLLEYSLLKSSEKTKDTVMHAEANLLDERQRAGQVLQVLRQALEERTFTVKYQPIYSVEKEAFSSAEALVYLFDETLGSIPPSEFIPIAEKNGLIGAIGDYVFEETCRFMVENQVWDMGIDYITVNLSPMQCIQEDLHIKLAAIMEKYRLEYFRISLEITDAGIVMKGKKLEENMQILINKGMRFSLDNYGTGYSNLNTVVEYPFSIVKLDKSMLWNAMKSEKAMTVLRQTIRMMKQLSMELIAVGVETEEQAQLLAYYGCDFFQGYYYAKPMPGDEFVKFVADYMMKKTSEVQEVI